jgi:hypothetical protein
MFIFNLNFNFNFDIHFALKLKIESEDEIRNKILSSQTTFTQRGGNNFPA